MYVSTISTASDKTHRRPDPTPTSPNPPPSKTIKQENTPETPKYKTSAKAKVPITPKVARANDHAHLTNSGLPSPPTKQESPTLPKSEAQVLLPSPAETVPVHAGIKSDPQVTAGDSRPLESKSILHVPAVESVKPVVKPAPKVFCREARTNQQQADRSGSCCIAEKEAGRGYR